MLRRSQVWYVFAMEVWANVGSASRVEDSWASQFLLGCWGVWFWWQFWCWFCGTWTWERWLRHFLSIRAECWCLHWGRHAVLEMALVVVRVLVAIFLEKNAIHLLVVAFYINSFVWKSFPFLCRQIFSFLQNLDIIHKSTAHKEQFRSVMWRFFCHISPPKFCFHQAGASSQKWSSDLSCSLLTDLGVLFLQPQFHI